MLADREHTVLPETTMLPLGPHKQEFIDRVRGLCEAIRGLPLYEELEARLNRDFGPQTEAYAHLASLLKVGVEEGWVAYEDIQGADYRRGRILEPSRETSEMSVESGLLRDVKGQYHCHTNGEINMIIPLEAGAQFCGHGAGWRVFPPMSEHFPTVTGRALMMYFLPGGEIQYLMPPAE
jgi:2-hydroxylaminobenzoate mutase